MRKGSMFAARSKWLLLAAVIALPFGLAGCPTQAPLYGWTYSQKGFDWLGAEAIQGTSDGGFVAVANATEDNTSTDAHTLVVRANASGTVVWQKTYTDFGQDDYGNVDVCKVVEADDGGIVLFGTAHPKSGVDTTQVLKLDADGKRVWTKTLDRFVDSYASGLAKAPDGGYVICGDGYSDAHGSESYFVKIDATGNIVWENYMPRDNRPWLELNNVCATADGGYALLITAYGTQENHVVVHKTNGTGTTTSEMDFGVMPRMTRIAQATDGGFILAGERMILSAAVVHLAKISSAGDIEWENDYPFGDNPAHYVNCEGVYQTADGGFVTGGRHADSTGWNAQPFLLKVDATGAVLQSRLYNSANANSTIGSASDGGFFFGASWTRRVDGELIPHSDLYVFKTDSDGTPQ